MRIKVLFPLSEANEVNVFFCLLSLYVNMLVLRDISVQLPQCNVYFIDSFVGMFCHIMLKDFIKNIHLSLYFFLVLTALYRLWLDVITC